MRKLERLARKVLCCRQCRGLNIPGVTEAAPAFGNPHSPIMFIGQSNHAYNPETPDRQLPFMNRAGRPHAGDILFPAIEAAGINRWDVFITNVVKCHPPRNRYCTPEETTACRRWLAEEIALVKPKLIACLGNAAGEALNVPTKYRICKSEITLTNKRKKTEYVYEFHGALLPHPAYILRLLGHENPDEVAKGEAEQARFNAYITWLIGVFHDGHGEAHP